MKQILILIFLLFYNSLNAQNWDLLPHTKIQNNITSYRLDSMAYFQKDSSVIAVPVILQNDFAQLFANNHGAFDLIYKACDGMLIQFLADSLQRHLKNSGVRHVVYFTKRTIMQIDNTIIWTMENLSYQGQLCWPIIYLKRLDGDKKKILFTSIDSGPCEI